MVKYNVIVYPCSSGIGNEIYHSLKNNKDIELYGLNIGYKTRGYYLYENYYDFMSYKDEDLFINEIKNFINRHKITTIIPADDNAVIIFKKYEEELNVKVITSPLETSLIARSKKLTYEKLNLVDNIIPKTYNFRDDIKYPVFIKPDNGAGGINSKIINNIDELKEYIMVFGNNYVICEYLPGEEYTVECFTDNCGKLICSIPRKRIGISKGLSINNELLYDNEIVRKIKNISELINSELKFIGSWFFQLKESTSRSLKLMEISTRLPGSSSIIRNLGVNMTLLSLLLHHGEEVGLTKKFDRNFSMFTSNFKIYKNYYHTPKLIGINKLYVDLDDTLILKNKVNIDIISLIYKFKNKGKKVFLLTKHKEDIYETLNKYLINYNLFDELIVIDGKKYSKEDFIENNSIFVDDSFGEREQVNRHKHNNDNIFTFDTDSIEILLNDKNI